MATVVVTPYNIFPDPPTIGGTWAVVSAHAAVPSFVPSNVYNCTMTFDDTVHAFEDYILEYTIDGCNPGETLSQQVTVTFANSFPAPNDECVSAYAMPYIVGGTNGLFNQSIGDNCPGPVYTVSASLPASWTGAQAGDGWYKVVYVAGSAPYPGFARVRIDGTPYGADGIQNINWGIYSPNCATLDSHGSEPSQVYEAIVALDFSVNQTFYIRVGAPSGQEGKFDITITF